MQRIETRAIHCNLSNPGLGIGTPVCRHQVVHVSSGLAFDLQRLQVREAFHEAGGGGSVAEGNCDLFPGEVVYVVPLLTDQRDGESVPGIIDEREDEAKCLFWDALVASLSAGSHSYNSAKRWKENLTKTVLSGSALHSNVGERRTRRDLNTGHPLKPYFSLAPNRRNLTRSGL